MVTQKTNKNAESNASKSASTGFTQAESKPIIATARPGLASSDSALKCRLPTEYGARTVRDTLAYIVGAEYKQSEAQTVTSLKNELGADLMLLGDINDVKERSIDGRTVVSYFQVNLDLTDIETNEKAWIGSVDIKKVSRER